MENKKLTLENIDELGLDLLKQENRNSNELEFYWDYTEELSPKSMKEIREIKDEMKYESLKNAVENYVLDLNVDVELEMKDELVNSVLNNYVDYHEDSEEYEEISEKLYDMINDEFVVNTNVDTLLRNTRVSDIAFVLSPNGNENFYLSQFNNSEEFRDDVPQDSPMFFLIQSQGYEVEDLYDDEKVEKSPFLKSLSKEVKGFTSYVKIGFYADMNLDELIYLEETDKNIIIPKITGTDIVLEKDIVVGKDQIKIYSDYSEEIEESNYSIGEHLRKGKDKIKATDEKTFEMHEVNTEKVYEKLKFLEEKEEHKEKMKDIDNKNNRYVPFLGADLDNSVKEMQGGFLKFLEEKGYIEKENKEYKFKKDVLERENFDSLADDYLSKSLDFGNDVFLENFSYEDLAKRFELELPKFKIYDENGEFLYNSEERKNNDYEKIEKFIIDKIDEEFWNNMQLSNSESWEELINNGAVTILSNISNRNYDNYTDFIYEEIDNNELSNKIYEENRVYLEDLRIDLVENSKDNTITMEKYDDLKEKYLRDDYDEDEYEYDEIEEKENNKGMEL